MRFTEVVFWAATQRTALSSTLRRLGEELYRPRPQRVGDDTDRPQEAFFFRSQEAHVRFLSALIILKTVSQGGASLQTIHQTQYKVKQHVHLHALQCMAIAD